MADRVEIVAIGASAGGVEAPSGLMAELPPGLPLAILVALHISSARTSVLAEILRRSGRLPTEAAADGMTVRPGHVYVAPPDHHLVVANGRTRLERGPRENGHRPAADPLMRSVASPRWRWGCAPKGERDPTRRPASARCRLDDRRRTLRLGRRETGRQIRIVIQQGCPRHRLSVTNRRMR